MRLAGAVTQGSGRINEDGLGFQGNADDVTAAWVLDGVTGINGRSYLPAETDAVWLVGQAQNHLQTLVNSGKSLPEIMFQLVAALIADWQQATRGMIIPENFDPPGACLILAKRFGTNWQAARLGDSCLLARSTAGILKNNPCTWVSSHMLGKFLSAFPDVKNILETVVFPGFLRTIHDKVDKPLCPVRPMLGKFPTIRTGSADCGRQARLD